MNKREVLDKINTQLDETLNGDWNRFKESLEHLRWEVDELTPEEVKRLRKHLSSKIDKRCNLT